jgi:Domain of unknown function (DUF6265)
MRHLAAAAAALLLVGAAPEAKRDDDLGWLAGTWLAEEAGGNWTEERWARPRGGVMLGTSLSGQGTKAGWFEFMRIAADQDGRLAFHASPGGAPASAFPLIGGGAREAVFENPAHDYPTRIVYRREGKVLSATISGPGGAKPRSWRFRKVG